MSGALLKRHEIKLLLVCMFLLALAAGWLLSTRPGPRIEADFMAREERRVVDTWLVEQSRTNPVAEHRALACYSLGRIGGEEATARLINALDDPAPSVRAAAAFGLGLIEDRRIIRGDSPEQQAATALMAALSDEDRRTVTYAVEALGKMHWKDAAGLIVRTPAPVTYTLTALVRMGASEFAPYIQKMLRSDDQDTRWAAATALEEFEEPIDDELRDRYLRLATDVNAFVRAAVARGLGRLQPSEEVFKALDKLAQDRDPKIRIEAFRSLGRLGDQTHIGPLEAALNDSNQNVRDEAGRAIRSLVDQVKPLPPRDPQPTQPVPETMAEPYEAEKLQEIARTLGRQLTVETPLGGFDLQLDYENAPLAAERFFQMARSGAFDGARFTAVRPDGYVQVAPKDAPPPKALRTEINAVPFLRGSVGMVRAGAGVDTPEFFIALTSMPFSDSRYTNVGRLVSGDALLDQFTAGMRVLAMKPPGR